MLLSSSSSSSSFFVLFTSASTGFTNAAAAATSKAVVTTTKPSINFDILLNNDHQQQQQQQQQQPIWVQQMEIIEKQRQHNNFKKKTTTIKNQNKKQSTRNNSRNENNNNNNEKECVTATTTTTTHNTDTTINNNAITGILASPSSYNNNDSNNNNNNSCNDGYQCVNGLCVIINNDDNNNNNNNNNNDYNYSSSITHNNNNNARRKLNHYYSKNCLNSDHNNNYYKDNNRICDCSNIQRIQGGYIGTITCTDFDEEYTCIKRNRCAALTTTYTWIYDDGHNNLGSFESTSVTTKRILTFQDDSVEINYTGPNIDYFNQQITSIVIDGCNCNFETQNFYILCNTRYDIITILACPNTRIERNWACEKLSLKELIGIDPTCEEKTPAPISSAPVTRAPVRTPAPITTRAPVLLTPRPIVSVPTTRPPSPVLTPTTPRPTPAPPSNDSCINAIRISIGSIIIESTSYSRYYIKEIPLCFNSIPSPGVWYTIIGTGETLTAETCNEITNYDTRIDIFTISNTTNKDCRTGLDTCNAFNDESDLCINDEFNENNIIGQSSVSWITTKDILYYIFVHGYNDAGTFQLSVNIAAPTSPPMPQSSPSSPTTLFPPITIVPPSSIASPPSDNGGDGTGNIFLDFFNGLFGGIFNFDITELLNISNGLCFSKTNLVHVQNKGYITIDKLQIGDYVQVSDYDDDDDNTTTNNKLIQKQQYYSRVISLSHKNHYKEAEFIQIYTKSIAEDDDNNSFIRNENINNDTAIIPQQRRQQQPSSPPLEISHNHMIIVNTRNTDNSSSNFWNKMINIRCAKDIHIGDIIQDGTLIVTNVTIVKRYGLYAPITESGTILVSGITASTYVAILKTNIRPIIQHYSAHILYIPMRFYNYYYNLLNKNNNNNNNNNIIYSEEEYNEDGIAKNYIFHIIKIILYLEQNYPNFFLFITVLMFIPLMMIFFLHLNGFYYNLCRYRSTTTTTSMR